MSPYLMSKLANGHSRNLVIRGALGRLTETQLREDMEVRTAVDVVLLIMLMSTSESISTT